MPAHSLSQRLFAAVGAFACAGAIALGAYAAHGVADAVSRSRLETAVFHLLIHGLALAVFAPRQSTRLGLAVLWGWFGGIGLFCGSLIAAALWNTPTTLAPVGGMLLILAWLVQGIVSLRR